MTAFLIFILLGNGLLSIGVMTQEFWLMLVGRIIYGIGGDSLLVIQWAYIAEYFNEDRIGIASVYLFLF